MKTLIVSDYDGTLKKRGNESELKQSIKQIKKIIDDNNTFMISTGRLYKSMSFEVNEYDIPFNYISCANGNILFDNNYNVIFKTNINSTIIKDLQQYYNHILSIEPLDEYGIITHNNPTEYLIKIINDIKIRRQIVNMLWKSPYVDYCTDGDNKYTIHVFNLSNKIRTIEILRKKLKIPESAIYTIGDGINDLNIIKKYNGALVGDVFKNDENLNNLPKYDSFSACAEEIQLNLKRRTK